MAPAKSPKTARFATVVERSGQPKVHVSWVAPEKDSVLQKALKQDRVLTVASRLGGGKADRGYVGFDASHAKGAQILVFPKSLKPFAGADIIGVKFDLVDQPDLAPAAAEPKAKKRPKEKARARPPSAPEVAALANAKAAVPGKPARLRPSFEEPATRPATGLSTARSKSQGSAKAARPAPDGVERDSTGTVKDYAMLVDEVKKALEELQEGKAVAAYQRLERAVEGKA